MKRCTECIFQDMSLSAAAHHERSTGHTVTTVYFWAGCFQCDWSEYPFSSAPDTRRLTRAHEASHPGHSTFAAELLPEAPRTES